MSEDSAVEGDFSRIEDHSVASGRAQPAKNAAVGELVRTIWFRLEDILRVTDPSCVSIEKNKSTWRSLVPRGHEDKETLTHEFDDEEKDSD